MTFEEMELTLRRLAELQESNQHLLRETMGSVRKLSDLVVRFAEDQNASLLRLEGSLLRLEGVAEAFIRGSQNGGKQG
jgi:hypothetical protein